MADRVRTMPASARQNGRKYLEVPGQSGRYVELADTRLGNEIVVSGGKVRPTPKDLGRAIDVASSVLANAPLPAMINTLFFAGPSTIAQSTDPANGFRNSTTSVGMIAWANEASGHRLRIASADQGGVGGNVTPPASNPQPPEAVGLQVLMPGYITKAKAQGAECIVILGSGGDEAQFIASETIAAYEAIFAMIRAAGLWCAVSNGTVRGTRGTDSHNSRWSSGPNAGKLTFEDRIATQEWLKNVASLREGIIFYDSWEASLDQASKALSYDAPGGWQPKEDFLRDGVHHFTPCGRAIGAGALFPALAAKGVIGSTVWSRPYVDGDAILTRNPRFTEVSANDGFLSAGVSMASGQVKPDGWNINSGGVSGVSIVVSRETRRGKPGLLLTFSGTPAAAGTGYIRPITASVIPPRKAGERIDMRFELEHTDLPGLMNLSAFASSANGHESRSARSHSGGPYPGDKLKALTGAGIVRFSAAHPGLNSDATSTTAGIEWNYDAGVPLSGSLWITDAAAKAV